MCQVPKSVGDGIKLEQYIIIMFPGYCCILVGGRTEKEYCCILVGGRSEKEYCCILVGGRREKGGRVLLIGNQ